MDPGKDTQTKCTHMYLQVPALLPPSCFGLIHDIIGHEKECLELKREKGCCMPLSLSVPICLSFSLPLSWLLFPQSIKFSPSFLLLPSLFFAHCQPILLYFVPLSVTKALTLRYSTHACTHPPTPPPHKHTHTHTHTHTFAVAHPFHTPSQNKCFPLFFIGQLTRTHQMTERPNNHQPSVHLSYAELPLH